jgi:NADPH:quinone reductase-like Zn-dependent oxidoreductase
MRAAFVRSFDPEAPERAVEVGEFEEAARPDGWTTIAVRAASVNHHDVWSARGVGLAAEALPMVIGCDAAGTDEDGAEVVVHPVINDPAWAGPEEDDPRLSLFSERFPGTFAERVSVPAQNVFPKPAGLTFEQAACLPTAWLTAYRMLFTKAEIKPGQRILVQGASGGLSTALIMLAGKAGAEVWATSRTEEGRQWALDLGAGRAFDPGARLPERVDAVFDSVGGPTWRHSLRCLRRGGRMVVAGGTGGYTAEVEVARIFGLGLQILGVTVGTRAEFGRLLNFCQVNGLRPPIDRTLPLAEAPEAIRAVAAGEVRGKLVLVP